MEEFELRLKELVAGQFGAMVESNQEVNMNEFYSSVMSATLSIIGTIAQFTGEDPKKIIKSILTDTLNQI